MTDKGKAKAVAEPEEQEGIETVNTSSAPSSSASSSSATPSTSLVDSSPENLQMLEKLMAAMQNAEKSRKYAEKYSDEAEKKDNHKFWSTQPVLDRDDNTDDNTAIEPDKKPEEIRQTPYNLPAGFEWTEVDVTNEAELKELYELLTFNYVEDDDAMFRFDYSADFLRWALQPPGWLKSWHPGVRVSTTKKLVAFISGIPADIRIYQHHQVMAEVNFLCVHKKLRTKRLAPVLIKEITRRVHQQNIFQAAYTAGIRLPRPVSSCQYYHRSLNPKKLIETGFSHLSRNMSMSGTIKLYKLPEKAATPGLRPMIEADVEQVHLLITTQLSLYSLAPLFSIEDVKHWFLPRRGIVYSYVVEDPSSHAVTDFISFYSLPSSVINHPVHKQLNAAYLFYYAQSKTPLTQLAKDTLIQAKLNDFDVFNCLNLMHNQTFLEELKFGPGDGHLQYYLYNWACKKLEHDQCGLVLL